MTILRFKVARVASMLALLALATGPFARAQEDDDEAPTKKLKAHRDTSDDSTAAVKVTSEADKQAVSQATQILSQYLDFVKAKKWDKARALTHPLTLAAIASTKKRLGEERHSMAPWFWAKDSFYLTNDKITDVSPAVDGTVVATTLEDSFQVQEKGELTDEKAAYLLGKSGGKWYVVDKKSEADGFTKDAIKYGYPKYFDKVSAAQ
jgi:hypothetical protein